MLLIENITYVYISKAKNTQPDKPSEPPSQAHCQSFTRTPSLGLNTAGPFCGPKDPEGVYTSEWPSPCTQPLPRYGLKQAKKVGTPSSCVRIILRVHHMPKSQAHPLKLCTNNGPTCAGLTHTSDSNSTLDRCQQAGRNFSGGQYISNGSLSQTVQIYPLLFFSLTAQLGHILAVPKHTKKALL
jgi:hypothetical protein